MPHTTKTGLAALIATLAACNQIGNIHGGLPRECSLVSDCSVVTPECRLAIACDDGRCIFEDAPEGTPLQMQAIGDCVDLVCDSAEKTKLLENPMDIADDGDPCTEDRCLHGQPSHQTMAELSCYTGPWWTRDTGLCHDGIQHCDAQGQPIGGCEGQVLPQEEDCDPPTKDEDCDGQANEEGNSCVCAPGSLVVCSYSGPPGTEGIGICHGPKKSCNPDGLSYGPCLGQEQTPLPESCDAAMWDEDCDGNVNEGGSGCTCGDGYLSTDSEECDDGNLPTDTCTPSCELAKCGDGIIQKILGEECDDGNTDPGDACPSNCGSPIVHVTASQYTCASCGGGTVKCWGDGWNGPLGLGDIENRGDNPNEMGDALPIVNLGAGKIAKIIAAGGGSTCAILHDNSIKCWGENSFGQLGLGDTQNRGDNPDEMGDNLPPVDLGTGKTAKAIAPGSRHTCAILNDDSVKCWGSNYRGLLGLGDQIQHGDTPYGMGDNLPPVDLGTGKTAKAIAVGWQHTCAILNDESVKCWGGNSSFGPPGLLGLGDTDGRGDNSNEMGDSLPAVNLGTGKTARAIAAGTLSTCVILNDGSLKCWGYNIDGELGLGDTELRGDQPGEMGDNLPVVNVGTGKTAKAIALGGGHACAILNDKSVKCWGYNIDGELGLGDIETHGANPNEMGDALPAVDLGTGKTAKAIAAGGGHACALLNDDSVKCWGDNYRGQLGLGDTELRGDQPGEMGDNLPAVLPW